MNLIQRLMIIILPLYALIEMAQAQQLQETSISAIEREQLESSFSVLASSFENEFRNNRIGDMLDFFPPKLKQVALNDIGMTDDTLRSFWQDRWDDTLRFVTIEEASFDFTRNEILRLDTGEFYRFIPTHISMRMRQNTTEFIDISSVTLALTEDGSWYMITINEASQVDYVYKTYPALQTIELPLPIIKQYKRDLE